MSDDSTGSGVSRRRYLTTAGAVGAAGLAGCAGGGGGGGSDGSTTGSSGDEIGGTVTVFSGSAFVDSGIVDALHEAGVPDSVTIEMTVPPQDTGSKQQQLRTAINAEESDPDLVLTDNGWTIPFIVRDDLVNLEEEMDEEFISRVREEGVQSMIDTGTHPETGDLYSIPVFPDYPVITYRKDLLRNAGYGDSDFETWRSDPPTWAEFSTIVSEAMGGSDVQYGHLWQGNNYAGLACCTFNEFLTSMGGAFFGGQDNLFGPVGDRPVTLDSEESIDGIEAAVDIIHGTGSAPMDISGVSPQEVAGWIEPDTKSTFENGSAVTQRNWTYSIGGAVSAFEGTDMELGVMPLPAGPNGSWHAQGGWIMSMNPYTDNMASAKEVIKAWWEDSVLQHQFDAANYMPPKPELFGYVEESDTYGPYFEALQYSAENLIPRPTTSVWPNQRTIIASEVNSALRQEQSPQEAATAMQEQISAIEEQS
ncbi:extracellular solute-binding protein [Halorubrum cibi]|uniref:Carbohydrate ABC transporter substrate-binding protein, CUT1 family n=1 Tax=Halorubrum cibi TaxID=413815 RepID=A0A521BXW5_9EURY|nr:extracellular solute-binding protein [Halorubrum cibi]SMO52016.1 carbohydrate ABC transporter substrate-binding protein, CUT1 family [Halorubrum cibi]